MMAPLRRLRVTTARRGRPLLVLTLLAAVGCGKSVVSPTITLLDRDRHGHFTADAKSIVYYRQDERAGGAPGIYRVDLASGEVTKLADAVLAGLDLDPRTDSVIFSARATNEAEPSLWMIGLDGGGLRRVGGGGNIGPGFRWPSFSTDGSRIAWDTHYEDDTNLDTANTLWIGDWQGDTIANAHAIGPGRHAAWRPDDAALAVERRRVGDAQPYVIALMDTTGKLLDTLGYGAEPTWRPDGATVAYLAETTSDRGCLGVCLVPAGGGTPVALSSDFMSFPGGWTRDGTKFVYARLMQTYRIADEPPIEVEESRLWVRTLATGADVQVTF